MISRFKNRTNHALPNPDISLATDTEPAPSSARAFLRATIPHRGHALSKIFVSHSNRDSFEAIGLVDWLAEAGWSEAFLNLDPERRIAAGECWERRLHEASQRCEAVIFRASRNWLASDWLTPWRNEQTFKPRSIGGRSISQCPAAGSRAVRREYGSTDLEPICEGDAPPPDLLTSQESSRHDQPPLETPPARLELGRFRP